MDHILLPEKYAGYLEKFTKHEYSHNFKKYCALSESFFDELEREPGKSKKAAMDFVSSIEKSLPGFWGRKLAIYDLCRFLFLYTVPAALNRNNEESRLFASELAAEWNSRFPKNPLNISDFSGLFNGFRTTIMGFDIGRN